MPLIVCRDTEEKGTRILSLYTYITNYNHILQGSDSITNSGYVSGLDKVFYMLMVSDVIALILLTRLVIGDFKRYLEARRINRHLPSAEALNT